MSKPARGKMLLANWSDIQQDDADLLCIQLSTQQVQAIRTQLGYLRWATRWQDVSADDKSTLDTIDTFVAEIEYQLTHPFDCSPETCEEDQCTNHNATSPYFAWYPNDPFVQGDVPAGYAFAPLVTGDRSGVLGALPTDVYVRQDAIIAFEDIEAVGSGLPRVVIPFVGLGQLEVTLMSVVGGGLARVYPDDNQLLNTWVDLALLDISDLLDTNAVDAILGVLLDGGLTAENQIEIDFATPGAHTLTIEFWPKYVDGLVPLGYGGGLRQVGFCGLEVTEAVQLEFDLAGCDLRYRLHSGLAWNVLGSVCGADGADGLTPILRSVTNSSCHDIQWQYAPEQEETWATLATVCNGADGIDGTDGTCPDCGADEAPDGTVPDVPEANRNFCRLAWGIFDNLTYYWRADLQKLYDLGLFPSATDLAVMSIIEDRTFSFSQLSELIDFYVVYTSLIDPEDIAAYATVHEDRFDASSAGESELIRNLIYCTLLANGSNITDQARAELAAQFLALEDSDGFWTSIAKYTLAVPDWAWKEWRLLGAYGYSDPFFDCTLGCSAVECDCNGETLIEEDAIADTAILITEGERAPFESEVAFHMDANGELEILLPARVCLKTVRISDPDGTVGPIDCELFVNGENLAEDDGGEALFQVWDNINRECQTLKLVCPTHNEYIAYCHITYCNEGA